MSNYLYIDAIAELSDLLSPCWDEEDEEDWWSCSRYIDVDTFNVCFSYEKCPPDEHGRQFVTKRVRKVFTMSEIIARLKEADLYVFRNLEN